jgi:hypothetical protein
MQSSACNSLLQQLNKLTDHLSLSYNSPKDLPALCKPRLSFEPIARMQKILHGVNMPMAHRDDAVKLSSSIVISLREVLDRYAQLVFNLAAKLTVDVLHRACADH